ncbi:hypothetical protein [Borreliella bavariensis]|uniref:hypothetical protein n=1 Tax=Borreliella bavariensis TaxID=664662 RepID=UPI001C003292|nr:hypothetical protein [Borreliella bavariensis]
MLFKIIIKSFALLFFLLLSCRTDGNLNELLSSGGSKAIQKTSKETSTSTDSGKSKIPIPRSRQSAADLSGTDMAVKAAVKESIDNKGTENTLTSIGSSIDVPKEESSKSTGATSGIEVSKLSKSTKSQGISSINDTQGPEKIEQEPAKAEEEQMKIEKRKQEERQKQEEERQKQEEERQKQEEEEKQRQEEEKQAKDKIEILVKKTDEINRDIDAIKNQSSFVEDVKRGIVEATEVIDKITGPIYDHFTDGADAIYIAWYDLDTDLEELLKKLRNTRGDLRAKLNEGNQRYIGVGNEPKLKENVKVFEIESDLDKLKSELKEVKEYLKNKSNFEKIKENIVNSDDE